MALTPVEWHTKVGGGGPGPSGFNQFLVPSAGCLFGAETPTSTAQGSTLAGLNLYEPIAGNDNDIVNIYKTNGWAGTPSTAERSQAIRAGHDRAIFRYTWKVSTADDPSGSQSWGQIAAGSRNSRIDQAADGLATYDRKVWLSIWHEPEDDVSTGGWSTSAYVDMWNFVIDRMVTRQGGFASSNIVPMVNYMGWRDWRDIIPELVVDASLVKWAAYDPYVYVPGKTVTTWLNDPVPAAGWTGMYDFLIAAYPGLPIMLAEWGFSFGTGGLSDSQVAALYNAMPAILEADFPMIKALCYWNSSVSAARNYRLQLRGATAQNAYRQLANHPYFNQVSTNLAP